MIKVPATDAGVPAIEELTARGVNVNVTLLFSVARYEQVIDAYIARPRATRRRRASRSTRSPRSRRSSSPASTPRPTPCSRRAPRCAARVAIANAQRAYARYLRALRRRALARRCSDAGARPQRPLWASTGTKDPAYSDVLYVERLIAPAWSTRCPSRRCTRSPTTATSTDALGVVTRRGLRDTRRAARRRHRPRAITAELEREGVRAFCDSYRELLDCIEAKARRLAPS